MRGPDEEVCDKGVVRRRTRILRMLMSQQHRGFDQESKTCTKQWQRSPASRGIDRKPQNRLVHELDTHRTGVEPIE